MSSRAGSARARSGPRATRVHPAARPRAAAAAVLALAACAACAKPPPSRVALRLDASRFAVAGAARDFAEVGEVARPVVAAPGTVHAAEALAVPVVEGRGRVTITLAPAAVALPDTAFALSYQALPDETRLVADGAREFATARAFAAWDGRFAVTRDAADPARATLEIETAAAIPAGAVNLRLDGMLAAPARLESTVFTVPRAARLEIGFGLARHGGAGTQRAARFAATLSCDGRDQLLLDRVVQGDAPGAQGWQESVHPLPAGAVCRLRLETASSGRDDARGAVWAVPVVTAPDATRPPVRNVVLVSLDTLRADHVSGYGYPRATSPRIDAELIAHGTTFRDVSTTFPQTDVAHASLLTSLYPAAQEPIGRIDPRGGVRTLAEALGASGMTTAAFTEDALVAGSFGFRIGFDEFVERPFVDQGRGVRIFGDGARWVAAHRDRPFFLFLHTYKTHAPYVSGRDYQTSFTTGDEGLPRIYRQVPAKGRADMDAYDRTIREADALLGGFLGELQRSGLAEDTLVVLVSDHGEAFGEHGVLRHGTGFQQEQLHVPLVLRGPGIPAATRVDTPASIVDVAPTVLDLLGLPPLPDAMGTSLAPALRGAALDGERPRFFSWLGSDRLGIRRGDRKILAAGERFEAFDLAIDPDEKLSHPLGAVARAAVARIVEEHNAAAAATRARTRAPDAGAGAAPIPGQVEESLRALGYL